MKILFDHQIFNWQIYGGISRYHYELLKSLPAYGLDVEIAVKYSNNYYLTKDEHSYCKRFFPGFNLRIRNEFIRNSNKSYTLERLSTQMFDIFHPTFYGDYFLESGLLKNKAFVLTVHDLIHERFYEKEPSIPQKHNLINRADRIIAISENTKNDILAYLPKIDPDKIKVIYHGSSLKKLLPFADSVKLKVTNREYVLFVGDRSEYKNFDRFIKAFALLVKKYKDLLFVCTGKSFTHNEIVILKELGLQEKVISISVDDVKLLCLYKHAQFFVFPSLYEGFGIPILEAFDAGCPIVLSKASCFPEIAGDAGFYFDPYDIESMYASMEQVLISSSIKTDLVLKGYERSKFFSWGKTAKLTADLYKTLKR